MTISRTRRRLLGLALLVFIVAPVLVHFVRIEALRRPIERQLSLAIGHEVRILGDLHFDLALMPHLHAERVTLPNPAGWRSPILAEVGSLRLDFHLWRFLSGVLEFHGLRLAGVDLFLERDSEGRWNWSEPAAAQESPETGDDHVQVQIDAARVGDLQIAYRDGRSGRSWDVNLRRLAMTGLAGHRSVRLDADGRLGGGSFDVSARLGTRSPAAEAGAARPLSVRGTLWGGRIEGAGTLGSPGALAGIDIGLSATFTDMDALSDAAGVDLSVLSPLTATARLRHTAGNLGLAGLEMKMGCESGAWAHVSGSVGDLLGATDVGLAARFGSPDAGPLGVLLGRELSGVGPFAGSATLSDQDGDVDVRELTLAGGHGGPVEIALEGMLEDILAAPTLSASVRMRARDLAAVGDTIGISLPPLGPVAAVASLGNEGRTLGITDMEASIGTGEATWAELTGHVHDAVAWRGIEIGGDLLLGDLAWLDRFLGVPAPDLAPLRGSFLLGDADGTLGVERFRIERLPDPLQILITGGIGDLRRLDEVDVSMKLAAQSLAVLGNVFGGGLAPIGPVELTGRIVGSRERLVGKDLAVHIDRTGFAAHVETSFEPGLRPRLSAFIQSPLVHMGDMSVAPHRERAMVHDGGAAEAPFPVHLLRTVDADVQVRIEQVMGPVGPAMDEVAASVRLEDGVLQVEDATIRFPEGEVTMGARIDTRTAEPSAWLTANASGVGLEGLVAQFTDEHLVSGVLDVDADLRSTGASVSQFLSGLAGEVLLVVEGGSTASTFSRVFAKDAGRALFSQAWRDGVQPVNCVIGDFRIENGVATSRTLILDSADLTIVGGGTIDFGKDALDITLTPKLRDPGMFSLVAPVTLTGSLTNPVYTPVTRSVVASAFRHFLDNTSRPFKAILAGGSPGLPRTGPCASALRRATD